MAPEIWRLQHRSNF